MILRNPLLLGCLAVLHPFIAAAAKGKAFASDSVGFNRPGGPYAEDDFRRDFGNFNTDGTFTDIVDGALRVSFPEGRMSDGRIEVLLDGRRGIDLKNLRFVAGEKGRMIGHLLLESFCGGYGATPGKGQFVLFDDVRWECRTR